MLKSLANFLLDLLFPKFCVSCSKFDTFFCEKCFKKVKTFKREIKLDLKANYLDKVFAAAYYEKPTDLLIHEMKYQGVKDIGITCARMMHFLLKIPKADLITFVPLHKKRLQERGFNQAEVIAQELSRLTKIPCQKLLIRTKHNKPQASISSRNKRLVSMKDVFFPLQKWRGTPVKTGEVRFRSVLLIDDVCTTGTTLNECAKVLKESGFKKVIGVVLAHSD